MYLNSKCPSLNNPHSFHLPHGPWKDFLLSAQQSRGLDQSFSFTQSFFFIMNIIGLCIIIIPQDGLLPHLIIHLEGSREEDLILFKRGERGKMTCPSPQSQKGAQMPTHLSVCLCLRIKRMELVLIDERLIIEQY